MRAVLLAAMMFSLTAGSAGAQVHQDTPPVGTMAQIMRAIYFPNANLIFDVQMRDPGAATSERGGDNSVTSTFAGIYTGWPVVENAALALAEAGNLINKTGRLCENGRYAPVERYDWLKWSNELTELSFEIYQAAQAKDREAVGELTNNLAQACDNCHSVYRSNAQQNRMRCLGSGIVLPE